MGARVPGPAYGPQATTLDEAHQPGAMGMLPRQPLELTNYGGWGRKFDKDSMPTPAERRRWYLEKLGRYHNQLKESAAHNSIPMQLLAVIILNELADIDARDVLQQKFTSLLKSGSLGM